MEASKADLEWSARIDQALEEYPEMREYLDAIRGNIEALANRIEAVRELHKPIDFGDGDQYCESCVEAFPWGGESIPYPCPTIQALEGE